MVVHAAPVRYLAVPAEARAGARVEARAAVWVLRVSVFCLLPLLVAFDPNFGARAYFAVLAATVLFVPLARAAERRFLPADPRNRASRPAARLHLAPPANGTAAPDDLPRRESA